jgi:polar amino acid transport system substrate-binding protein
MYDIEVELSRRLQMPFVYQPTSFENIITGVQGGKFDIGNGVDATPTRQEVVDIVPLYQGSYSFLVLADQGRWHSLTHQLETAALYLPTSLPHRH